MGSGNEEATGPQAWEIVFYFPQSWEFVGKEQGKTLQKKEIFGKLKWDTKSFLMLGNKWNLFPKQEKLLENHCMQLFPNHGKSFGF